LQLALDGTGITILPLWMALDPAVAKRLVPGLLEVMPMRWRPAAWRDVHINYAESSICVFACHGDRVGIADETDMREVVGLPQREIAFGVVRRDRWYRCGG
jgi:hypothetical protein